MSIRILVPVLTVLWSPLAFSQQDPDSDSEALESLESAVFILPPRPRNAELVDQAQVLTKALETEVDVREHLRLIPMDAVGLIHDVAAELYASSCPRDEIIGCAYVLGDRGGADYAVATEIDRVAEGLRLQVHLVDVENAEEAFSFQLILEPGNEKAYADGVAKLIRSLAVGRLGKKDDIRQSKMSDRDSEVRANQEAADQLQQLGTELGDVSTLTQRRHGKIQRPKISEKDLMRKAQTDGVKPWERLNMSAKEYLRYQNSGHSLQEWRQRTRGRKNQIIVRPQIGGGQSWSDTTYFGHVVSSEETLEPMETWAWQALALHGGLISEVSIGFGLRPELEVGVTAGVATGTYSVQIDRSVESQTTTEGRPFDYPSQTVFSGGYMRVSALPDWSIRPVIFGGIAWWWGSRISDHDLNLPPGDLPDFDPAQFVVIRSGAGVEARLSPNVDVVADVPILFRTGGSVSQQEWSGIDTGLEMVSVPQVDRMGFGVQVGLQVRMLGKDKSRPGLDDYVD